MLERLRKYGLFIKLSKCEFSIEEVDFLGFRIGVIGVLIDLYRVESI